ncbi:tRNA epoxyqueuosine(34) reductase QueG [bacterium]|nr:tRNA epoxyqueuosine(34) reductase QueG [bacterium]
MQAPLQAVQPAPARRELLLSAMREAGFDDCRIAPPQLDPEAMAQHLKWIARGNAADMWYLERKPEARYDAGSLLPECASVAVGALSYYQAGDYQPAGGTGRVSRYAWGSDYHDVLGAKLTAVGQRLQQHDPELRWKVCVDTSPLSEKAFALRAGLGWHGRNSLVLHPRLGTYFFIGLLLLSWPLKADGPLERDCGTCTLCLRACPTEALSGPGILDSRRCVSYITTERREETALHEKLSGWLYGCDTCQEVCPFNAGLPDSSEAAFAPRPWSRALSAEQALEMDEAQFQQHFRGTVFLRRRLGRLQAQARNILAAAAAQSES